MTAKTLALGVLLVVTLGGAWAAAQEPGPRPDQSAQPEFSRPPLDRIQSTTRDILADPRYRPHKTLAQWLMAQLHDWDSRDRKPRTGWRAVVFWLFITWCAITLVAILVHIAWTLLPMLRRGSGAARRPPTPPGLSPHLELPYEVLLNSARQAADSGDNRMAIHWMMLALLRWLADRRLIALHPSKTNGDYVREVSRAADAAGGLMSEFASEFDRFAYGGIDCGRGDFARMSNSFERIQAHAGAQA